MSIDWSEGLPLMIGPYDRADRDVAGDGRVLGGRRPRRADDQTVRGTAGATLPPPHLLPGLQLRRSGLGDSSGAGTVYTFSTVYRRRPGLHSRHKRHRPPGRGRAPVRAARGKEQHLAIGDAVTVEFAPVVDNGDPLPVYRVR